MSSKSYDEMVEKCAKMNKGEYFSLVVKHYRHIKTENSCILCEIGKRKRKYGNTHDIYPYFD